MFLSHQCGAPFLFVPPPCLFFQTGDNFTCAEQRTFGKCDFPFMISPLAAQWQGGFCQRTCRRCDCSAGSGVQCSISTSNDILASNGVIQGINRVLFPPPIFTKEQAIADAIAYNASVSKHCWFVGGLVGCQGWWGCVGGQVEVWGCYQLPMIL